MDPISTLKQQAQAKRDQTILKAKADYSHALRLLDELAKTLPSENRASHAEAVSRAVSP